MYLYQRTSAVIVATCLAVFGLGTTVAQADAGTLPPGDVSLYPVQSGGQGGQGGGIVTGPDGNLWYTVAAYASSGRRQLQSDQALQRPEHHPAARARARHAHNRRAIHRNHRLQREFSHADPDSERGGPACKERQRAVLPALACTDKPQGPGQITSDLALRFA
jgi:streptogramin lyase